ncbi:PapD-like protein [Pilobolus umbonatus]|nr:PapD-like protein [Pilobolus umbonatus]
MSVNIDVKDIIEFERPLTRVSKKTIHISNPHDKPVAFKVKTTAPKLYCVRPNSDIIQPNQTMAVSILLQAFKEEPPLDNKCKDKFLILSTLVEGDLEVMSIQDLWSHVESKARSSICQYKFSTLYSQPTHDQNDVVDTPVQNESSSIKEKEDDKVSDKLRLMEEELSKYKEEVKALREAGPIVIEKVQVKKTGYPLSIMILFALLTAALAYFYSQQ